MMAALGILLVASVAAAEERHSIGVGMDAGLPDGFVGSVSYRPHDLVTAHIGLGHNTNSFGLRVGASISPVATAIAPYLALEGGTYFEAETASWMRSTAKSAGLDDKTLDRIGYQFANGHLGLRFGKTNAVVFLQAGVSFIRGTAEVIKPKPELMPPVELLRETTVHVWIVSGRGGVVYYF
jgi:hypothetical protein